MSGVFKVGVFGGFFCCLVSSLVNQVNISTFDIFDLKCHEIDIRGGISFLEGTN